MGDVLGGDFVMRGPSTFLKSDQIVIAEMGPKRYSRNATSFLLRQKFESLADLADTVSRGSLRKIDVRFSNICQRPRPSTFNEIGAATGN